MRRPLSLIGIAVLLALLSGCPFKKKQPPLPQQAQAPTAAEQPAQPPPAPEPVETQPPPPQASKLSDIASQRNSARLDSAAKAALNEAADRLQHETDSRAVIVGFAEPKEAKSANLAALRAASAKDYLAKEKGIDSSRIETRTSSASGMKAETWIVPPGASFSEPDTEVVTAPPVKPSSPHVSPAAPSAGQQPSPAPAPAQSGKLIIQEGSAPSSQGPAGGALEDSSSHNKQTTEQLLKDTETNLNRINRPLSPDEQALVAQIKEYMKQSREATSSSDAGRARNLALKARLLSDELVKH